jgi:tetratricopeptide (TPR) repeat protein
MHKISINKLPRPRSQQPLAALMSALLMLGSLLLAGSCMSLGDIKFDNAPLMGMVYDTENLPCQGAAILLDGWEKGQTDVNGRFVLADVGRGKHTLTVKKPGLETLNLPFNFVDRKQIAYLKVISLKQLLEKTEESIADKKLDLAEGYIERAKAIDPVNPVLLYINALFFTKQEKYTEAAGLLEQLVTLGYKEAVIYLTLADIYQYRLQNFEKAALALDIYVKMRPQPETKTRLDNLVNTYGLAEVLKTKTLIAPNATPATPTPAPEQNNAVQEGQPVNTEPPPQY